MDANHHIVCKVRELLDDGVSIVWNAKTKALVMEHPVFRFTIVDWYVWNQYVQGSNYDEYAKHIAVSFLEAIQMKEMVDKLLTFPSGCGTVVIEESHKKETNDD